jgi:hypothetical protein
MIRLFALSVLAVSITASAEGSLVAGTAEDWHGVRPKLELSVHRGAEPATYVIKAVVTDLRDGRVMARPSLITKAGIPARADVGAVGDRGLMSVGFTVTVDAQGKTAAYSGEVREDAQVISSQSATLAVSQ